MIGTLPDISLASVIFLVRVYYFFSLFGNHWMETRVSGVGTDIQSQCGKINAKMQGEAQAKELTEQKQGNSDATHAQILYMHFTDFKGNLTYNTYYYYPFKHLMTSLIKSHGVPKTQFLVSSAVTSVKHSYHLEHAFIHAFISFTQLSD